jgi:CheY-like chemotaxis protein
LTDLMGGEMRVDSTPGVGSIFHVKLFLPEVHMPAASSLQAKGSKSQNRVFVRQARLGYVGPRRSVLVVDNEAADRELLTRLLQPIGFEVRCAASGHDCLDLIAAGLQPDVILMDLAMPGIDGWETIRRLRDMWHSSSATPPHIAIVSANAFDRGLDNDAGIPIEDFILKPLRHSDLLDWLERHLNLSWLETPTEADKTDPASAPLVWPERAQLDALRELTALGFYRGILKQLDDISQQSPQCQVFVERMRALAKKFQFEAMLSQMSAIADEN